MDFSTKELVAAIDRADVASSKNLLRGFDVNQREPIHNAKPFWLEEMLRVDHKKENRDRYNRIWEMMMSRAEGALPSLAEDSIAVFSLNNREAAATIVLAALRELPSEKLDILRKVFSEKSLETVSNRNFRGELKSNMEEVRRRVVQRLDAGASPFDKNVASSLGVDVMYSLRRPLPVSSSLGFRPASDFSTKSSPKESSLPTDLPQFQEPVMNVTLEDIGGLELTEVAPQTPASGTWVRKGRRIWLDSTSELSKK